MAKNVSLQLNDELVDRIDAFLVEYNKKNIPVTRNALIKHAILQYMNDWYNKQD